MELSSAGSVPKHGGLAGSGRLFVFNEVWIAAFAKDPGPEFIGFIGAFAWVRIVNAARR